SRRLGSKARRTRRCTGPRRHQAQAGFTLAAPPRQVSGSFGPQKGAGRIGARLRTGGPAMTEAEWCENADPITMIAHLHRRSWRTLGLRRHTPSERRLRLLLLALGRRFRPDPHRRYVCDEEAAGGGRLDDALEAAERKADGLPCDHKFAYIFNHPSAQWVVRQ